MEKTFLEESLEDKKFSRIYEQESLIEDVRESIYEAMDNCSFTHKELAAKLGVSKARISTALGGSNLTLKSVADIAFVMNFDVKFEFNAKPEWQTFKSVSRSTRKCTVFDISAHRKVINDSFDDGRENGWTKVTAAI